MTVPVRQATMYLHATHYITLDRESYAKVGNIAGRVGLNAAYCPWNKLVTEAVMKPPSRDNRE